ncbi:hypothetical protein [Streptomyces cyanogenus]|uniref:Uncharacterized protein n=1 Tax=Streptomyces cyanogenus TaxID=80860 RepID=A0ABX7TN54_STRCY|nr:hypothetical protein [Streptomyces cyanogenus]QTD97023.1 hypothetical protein S1361_06640 [Streptomyces cyanogenus]
MPRRTGEPPHHHNLTCYTNYGCRLPECVERYNAAERDRRNRKQQGNYQRFTEAGPVRTHVQQLIAAGATPRGIAIKANVGDKVVRGLLPTRADGTRMPLKHRLVADNAAKLLALTADDVVPQYTPAFGTIRRLQALAADGWPQKVIARHVGLYPSYISQLLWRASTNAELQVRGSTALAVARAHDALRGKKPTRNGVARKAYKLVRAAAQEHNWPPTSYWDQHPGAIDDPHFEPLYGVTRREIVAQDAAWVMRTAGLDRHAVAERLGVHKSYLDHAFREYPQYAIGVAA